MLTRARLRPANKTDRRNFAQEASVKARGMAKQHLITDQTRAGTIFAETDDELAYLVFVAPDYPQRFADELVDKHARMVESMAGDGTYHSPLGPRVLCPTRPESTARRHARHV